MFCMKCGKQIQDAEAFCAECLEVMEKYPVKPGTHIQLPNRSDDGAKKAAQKKTLSTKEQNLRLRKTLRVLSAMLAVSLLSLVVTVSLLVHTAQDRDTKGAIGKNYNTVNTDTGDR